MTYARNYFLHACVGLLLNGCAVLPFNSHMNDPSDGLKHPTRAYTNVTVEDLGNKPFVGLAISGGGSRAANFGAAILEELGRHGFLKHVTAISAVSGGTLPAVYYALYRDKTNWEHLRRALSSNFYRRLLWKQFNPIGMFQYLFSPYNRSDMMADIFDEVLFNGATFRDLGMGQPYLLINGTVVPSNGNIMTFDDSYFASVGSRLDTYRLSYAVAASTSVPGIFHGMALRNYSNSVAEQYQHVLDGGVSENLGLEPLLNMVAELQMAANKPAGTQPLPCFLFVIDSFGGPSPIKRSKQNRDIREWTDYIIDKNIMEALDTSVTHGREKLLDQIGQSNWRDHATFTIRVPRAYVRTNDPPFYSRDYTCDVWHFSFSRLASTEPDVLRKPTVRYLHNNVIAIQEAVHQIETHWKLTAEGTCTTQDLQDVIYDAASILVNEQTGRLARTSRWFWANGLVLPSEKEGPSETEGPYHSFERNETIRLDRDPSNLPTGELLCQKL